TFAANMYPIIKKILFLWKAEKAHRLAMQLLHIATGLPFGKTIIRKLFYPSTSSLKTKLWGLTFPNPIGLAAGFDKDAKYIDLLEHLGFGFIEIGTVTPRAQPGNVRP